MKTKKYQPSEIVFKFANWVLFFCLIFFLSTTFYAIYKLFNKSTSVPLWSTHVHVSNRFYIICIVCSVVFATGVAVGLKYLNKNMKVKIAIFFLTTVISVYSIETVLEFSPSLKELKSKMMGVPYDSRSKIEVLNDLNDSGVEAYPNVHPQHLLRSTTNPHGLPTKDEGFIFPLGGISNKLMVMSNECGYWMSYKGDKFGFHNSNSVYQNTSVDILMTGDSFTEGWSVKSEENIGAGLQALGYNVINLGKSGNGPLLQFAALKEYAVPLKPKVVLWIYYANDLNNMVDEMKSSILKQYLDNNFTQNLFFRQKQIDGALKNYIESEWESQRLRLVDKSLRRIVKLYNLRKLFSWSPNRSFISMPSDSNFIIYKNILNESRKIVSGWGGKLYFVYLPSFYVYSEDTLPRDSFCVYEQSIREKVLTLVNSMDICSIDLHDEVFEPHADPLSLFPFRMFGHYNADGYRLVAQTIGKKLKLDGLLPSNFSIGGLSK